VLRVVNRFVERKDIKPFRVLKKYLITIPKNSQDTALYFSYRGLISFLLSSKKKKARTFYYWIVDDVIPSLLSIGSYTVSPKEVNKINKLNKIIRQQQEQLDKEREKNEQLKFNMKHGSKKYPQSKGVYALHKDNLHKLGKCTVCNKRMATYNTGYPDDVKLDHFMKCKEPYLVEKCLKIVLRNYIYRHNKEFYEISCKDLDLLMKKCRDLVDNGFKCEECETYNKNINDLLHHYESDHTTNMKRPSIKQESLYDLIIRIRKNIKGGALTESCDYTHEICSDICFEHNIYYGGTLCNETQKRIDNSIQIITEAECAKLMIQCGNYKTWQRNIIPKYLSI
jgi:hypothetical protein